MTDDEKMAFYKRHPGATPLNVLMWQGLSNRVLRILERGGVQNIGDLAQRIESWDRPIMPEGPHTSDDWRLMAKMKIRGEDFSYFYGFHDCLLDMRGMGTKSIMQCEEAVKAWRESLQWTHSDGSGSDGESTLQW